MKFGRGVDFVSGRRFLPSQRKLNTYEPAVLPNPCNTQQAVTLPGLLTRAARDSKPAWRESGSAEVGFRYHCTLSSSSLGRKPGRGSSKQSGLGMKGGLPPLEGYKSRLAWLAGQRNGFGITMCRRKWRTGCW